MFGSLFIWFGMFEISYARRHRRRRRFVSATVLWWIVYYDDFTVICSTWIYKQKMCQITRKINNKNQVITPKNHISVLLIFEELCLLSCLSIFTRLSGEPLTLLLKFALFLRLVGLWLKLVLSSSGAPKFSLLEPSLSMLDFSRCFLAFLLSSKYDSSFALELSLKLARKHVTECLLLAWSVPYK